MVVERVDRVTALEAERDAYKQALEIIADEWHGHAPGTDPRSKRQIALDALNQQEKT